MTLQVVVISVFLGALMIGFNIYMGLKTGWGEGGSLIAVVLGFSIMKALGWKRSIVANDGTQAPESAAGSPGGIVDVLPGGRGGLGVLCGHLLGAQPGGAHRSRAVGGPPPSPGPGARP